jgi:hypothetical protein
MSNEINIVEMSVEEILIDLLAERVMSIGVQASSTRGVQASLSIACRYGPSKVVEEKRTKHRYDLARENSNSEDQ